jgi:membrane protein
MEKEITEGKAGAFWTIMKKAGHRLKRNTPLHLAGATAFFATFSLAPIFVILVQLVGTLIGKAEVKRNIIKKLAESAPAESVAQLRKMMEGLEDLSGAWYINAGLAVFLFFSASTLFNIIRSSLYRLWRLKRVEKKNVGFTIRKRLFSVLLIVSAGALLMAGLLGQSFRSLLGEAIGDVSPTAYSYFQSFYKYLVSLLVAWVWFAVVFRYLTDVRPQWKTVMVGALFTSVLFNLGKLVLQSLLSGDSIPTVFGASASLVLLQLFVFYSSLLIYYGAAFTIEWARYHKQLIHLPEYVSYYTVEEKHTKEDRDHELYE